jgi:hypothetical protein
VVSILSPEKKPLLQFENRWHFLNFVAFLGLNLGTLAILLALYIEWPFRLPLLEQFLLARSSVIPNNVGNHSTIFLFVLATTWGIVALEIRQRGFKALLLEEEGMFRTLLLCLLIPAVHESEWLIVFTLRYGFTSLIITRISGGVVYSQWFASSILIFIAFLIFYGRKIKERKFAARFALSLVPMYAAWYAIGFPITINFNGVIYPAFLNLRVNGIEIGSWLYACVIFAILFVRYIGSRRKGVIRPLQRKYL